jgi:hypothetical protein
MQPTRGGADNGQGNAKRNYASFIVCQSELRGYIAFDGFWDWLIRTTAQQALDRIAAS